MGRNSRNSNENYERLKKQIFMQMVKSAAAICGIFLAAVLLIGGPIKNFIKYNFELSDTVWKVYRFFAKNHPALLLLGLLLLLFLLLFTGVFYRISSYVTELFHQVNEGLEGVVSKESDLEKLPEELDFIALKMEYCQTMLAEREREAKIAEQKKNDLVIYLAHDIKTPLTSVIGYLNLLNEASDMPPEQRAKYTGITLDKAYRLEELINEFFEITRYNLQSADIQKEEIDLYYMLYQMIEEFYPILTEKKQTAELSAEEDVKACGDSDKLARVFNNILKNAAAYGNPGSIIKISAEQMEKSVRISFTNTGKTIPKQKLQMIFEKFFRVDEARSSNTGGSGLGLAIAKEIVTLHGGTISAESEDGITVFTVVLPAVGRNEFSDTR